MFRDFEKLQRIKKSLNWSFKVLKGCLQLFPNLTNKWDFGKQQWRLTPQQSGEFKFKEAGNSFQHFSNSYTLKDQYCHCLTSLKKLCGVGSEPP